MRPGLHHPEMSFREEALFDGTEILTTLLWNTQQSLIGTKTRD
jgi:hypothetical protein